MIIKGKKKPQRNQKNQRNPGNFINCNNNEPKFLTKMRLYSYKINLAETSVEKFNLLAQKFFFENLIYEKFFATGELFSLNKNSSYNGITKINILLDELKKNEENSPRVIFFQSPPMIGMFNIIKYLKKNNFHIYIWNNSYGGENKNQYYKYIKKDERNCPIYKDGSIYMEYQKMKKFIENSSINSNNDNDTYFVILRNLPYDLFKMSLKQNNYTINFIKNWKPIILLFFDLIKAILTSKNYENIKLIFFTDDKEIDEFELRTIFPKEIIEHCLTYKIICNPIAQRKISDILNNFFDILTPSIFEENSCQNIIESIYLEFGSNIQQIFNYLIMEINRRYYFNNNKHSKSKNLRPLTQKGKTEIMEYIESQNKTNMKQNVFNNNNIKNNKSKKNFQIKKEQQLDHDLFRLLGKLLYNKRYVKEKNAILKLKKEEFIDNIETPRYYNIDELINDIPISNNAFNDLLIYNSIDHFNDLEEYSDVIDLYSFSDDIDNFQAFLYDKNNQYFFINSYMKTYLNCLGVTTYNMSQYNTNNKNKFNSRLLDKGLMIIKKPEIKINKNMNKFENNSFFKACEHFPCIISLSIKCFFKEGFFDLFKLNIGSNCDNNKNKNKKINSDNNEIKLYIKKKEENKYFKGNNKELSDNKNNKENLNQKNSDTPKNIEMRNIPEEERIIVENMFQENEDSDQDDILD